MTTAVPIVLGLANVFGQRQSAASTSVPAATLSVNALSSVRGGLLYTASCVE